MIFFIVSLITYFCFIILKIRKAVVALEKNRYSMTKYKKWIFSKKSFLTLELLGIIIIIVSFVCSIKITSICMIVLYMILSLLEIRNWDGKFKISNKNKKIIIFTLLTYILMFALIGIDYFNFSRGFIFYDRTAFYYPIVVVVGYLLYLIVYFWAFVFLKKKKKK